MPGSKKPEKEADESKNKVSRRTFLATGGAIVAVDAIVSSATGKAAVASPASTVTYPASTGYIVYDSRKCAGCTTCMLSRRCDERAGSSRANGSPSRTSSA